MTQSAGGSEAPRPAAGAPTRLSQFVGGTRPAHGRATRFGGPARLKKPGVKPPGGPVSLPAWLARLGPKFAAVGLGLAAFGKRLRRQWGSSLQLRVVSTTLVVSAVVVSLLGIFLMQQFKQNLLENAVAQARAQAAEGLSLAQTQGALYNPPGPGSAKLMRNLVTSLQPSEPNAGDQYGVAVGLAPNPDAFAGDRFDDWGLPTQDVNAALALQVETESGRTAGPVAEYASIPSSTNGAPATPGILIAAPLGVRYGLFYFFPLTNIQNYLSGLLQELALVGVALVFLLAAIAWLVTRWVVVPVARAAHGAQLLATGNLAERLSVRGNDEVAALATSFNEMAASLQDKMRELEDLSQVQRQFVSDVSHELRTPLTTIGMAADMIYEARALLEGPAARSAEILQGQIGRFESLLADLLEISRYDANVATLDAEFVDVCDLVRLSADVPQQLAERRGSRIEFRLPNEPCMAEVDRKRVERILRNLLVNAVEHGEGRDVVVSSAADSDAVAIAVRDYGVGLAAGEESLVFDRFWRADPARARTTGGTGLGLAIALEDARLHRGWLEAWGEPGQGSVFRLTLPREVGRDLLGSPLPLGPDPADLGGPLLPPRLTGAAPDGYSGHPGAIPGEEQR
jgi:two-component system sensor histidine kinase MtrB